MGYSIVVQTEKVGKTEKSVKVRHVRFFPKKDQRSKQIIGFGRLGFLVLNMKLQDNSGNIHDLNWSGYSGGAGKFKWIQPKQEVYDAVRDLNNRPVLHRGRQIPDTLSPKIIKAGEVTEFETHDQLATFLTRVVGLELMVEVIESFADRIAEINAKRAAKVAA